MSVDEAAVERAVTITEAARETHVRWLRWLDRPAGRCPICREDHHEHVEQVGDAEHQRRYIADYDHVLTVLRSTAEVRDAIKAEADKRLRALADEWAHYKYDQTMDTEWHRGHDDGLLQAAEELRTVLNTLTSTRPDPQPQPETRTDD